MRSAPAVLLILLWASLAPLPGGAAPAAAQTVTYRHPMGYSFAHPTGWKVEERQQGILILPPDLAQDGAGNVLEMIALGSQSAPGLTRPDDPQVIQFFQQSTPGLRQVGGPEPLSSGLGPGAVLTFEGNINGIDARRRIYVVLHNGEVVYLVHESSRDIAARRDAVARSLFTSLAYVQPTSDPQVVGQWRRTANSGSTDSRGGLFTQEDEVVALYPDGRVEYGKSTTISGTTSGVSVMGGGNPNVQRGRYTAAGGFIVITWEAGGTERLEYSLFMNEGVPHIRLGPSGTGARFFRRVN